MDKELTFGPFRLLHPLGRGGMGMVWRAVHRATEHPVAVKVMIAEKAREERYVTAFRDEVRAVAGLDHPSVIRIYDSGTVPEHAEDLTDGRLIAGSPYLVMELAKATLGAVALEQLTWPLVHTILMCTLDALAYSHARGLVHRDLKPENVLLFPGRKSSQLKLSDFGLAHATNAVDAAVSQGNSVSGTPPYMAPEQVGGRVRDQGPWTDLYALGCVTYWLVSGAPPFSSETTMETMRAHLNEPRPDLEPNIEVPDGFGDWAKRLLVRDENDRFRRAADAARELAELDEVTPKKQLTLKAHTDSGESVDLSIVNDPMATQLLNDVVARSFAGEQPPTKKEVAPLKEHLSRPAIPPSWRRADDTSPSMEMVGVGLGVYGLRHIPLVGREKERDILWNCVADSGHTGRPHAAVISGPAGIGKSRLARWLSERAHEVGAVDVLVASHSPLSGPADGLERMFADFLGCTGLERPQILERVRKLYSRTGSLDADIYHQCFALTELLARSTDPEFDEEDVQIRFSGPEEKFLVWDHLLTFLARERPLMLVLDDVHWGSQTLAFVRYLCERSERDDLPITLVLTARSEFGDGHELAEKLLVELQQKPLVRRLELEPLSDDEHQKLVRNLLGLQPKVADEVAQRTAGNPLFAIQLVGDWVERGLLEISDAGFRVPEGAEAALPESIQGLLSGRIEQLVGHGVDDEPSDDLIALELAATLGRKVDLREWKTVCELADLEVSAGLIDAMAARSLARPGDHSWTFIHGALRETLEAIADDHARLEGHHRLCVQILDTLYGAERDDMASRRARHLVAAGDDDAALNAFCRAMRYCWINAELKTGFALFERFEEVRRRLGLDDTDRRVIEGRLEKVVLFHHSFLFDESGQLLDEMEPVCRRQDWSDLLARINYLRARVAGTLGSIREGLKFGREALELYRELEDDYGIARASYKLGWLHRWSGEFDEAYALVEEAERRFAGLDDIYHYNLSLSTLGIICLGRQEYDRAIEYFQRARDGFEELGDTVQVANCHNDLGEVYRYQDNLDDAEEQYRRALQLNDRASPRANLFYNLNLACVLLEKGEFAAAIPSLANSLAAALADERLQFAGCAHAGMLAACAGTGDWTGFDDHLQKSSHYLASTDLVDRDLALSYQWAGEQALESGEQERAEAAFALAVEQWDELGRDARVAEIEKLIKS